MSMIDPCHTLRNPTNIVGEICLPRFQTECWAIPILCMTAHEHRHGYWRRQMNISNAISKDCNPIRQIVPLDWHYIDMNIYSYTHLVVIAIAANSVKSKYWTCSNASSQKTTARKNENNSTSPDRGNFFRLDAQPCSVLNVMPKVKERAWRARQFHEKIKRQNKSKRQQPKDSPPKNENNSNFPDRGNFVRLYGQPCSVLNVLPKVKERAWRAREYSELWNQNTEPIEMPTVKRQPFEKWKQFNLPWSVEFFRLFAQPYSVCST